MAATTTPILGLTRPDTANSIDVWGAELNASLDILDGHDHQENALIAIRPAAMIIDATLDWDNNDLTSLGVLGLAQVASTAIGGSLWRRTSDNELMWRTAGGVDVQLTNGASINATLIGGITGDYAATDADLEYSDSLKTYKMLQDETPDHYADLQVATLRIYEPASGITEAIDIRSPTGLVAGYVLTLPAIVPPTLTEVLTMNTSGDVDHSRALNIDDLDVIAGDVDIPAGRLVASGLLEGTRLYQTAPPDIHLSFADFICTSHHNGVSGQPNASNDANFYWSSGSGVALGPLVAALSRLPVGAEVTRIELYYHSSTGVGTWDADVVQLDTSTGVRTVPTTVQWTGLASSPVVPAELNTWNGAPLFTVAPASVYVLVIRPPASANSRGFGNAIITWSNPKP